ncbi:DUF6876 family protein [Falsiroseomonas ponticola]|uniref:DUF6876 family protein n=1 Tax=Falsiroseomonas ponticola TaxID=2786951 RepID=UPI0019346AFF|nr:DUF6876 family protein [Roseomonas ponticola]
MDANILREQLAQFTGSSTFTRHSLLRRMIMTEGVSWLADHAQSHWLTDAIASYQHEPRVSEEHFQVWRLRVNPETRSATLHMTNGNSDAEMVRQEIDYTDFPLDEITLWLIAQGDHLVLMLPSEY